MTTQIELIKKDKGIAPLEEVLKYRNENVPHRFKKHFAVSDEVADEVFVEMLKWLWMCAITVELNRLGKIDFKIGVIRGLPIIDHMWHNFILHTVAYEEFCDKYFSNFIHHLPTSKAEDDYRILSSDKFGGEVIDFYHNQHSLTFDLLGEETCNKWFVEYDQKYPKERLDELMRPLTYKYTISEKSN